jgi:hypothetical protein
MLEMTSTNLPANTIGGFTESDRQKLAGVSVKADTAFE